MNLKISFTEHLTRVSRGQDELVPPSVKHSQLTTDERNKTLFLDMYHGIVKGSSSSTYTPGCTSMIVIGIGVF